jgi:hypothetical protein
MLTPDFAPIAAKSEDIAPRFTVEPSDVSRRRYTQLGNAKAAPRAGGLCGGELCAPIVC